MAHKAGTPVMRQLPMMVVRLIMWVSLWVGTFLAWNDQRVARSRSVRLHRNLESSSTVKKNIAVPALK